MTQTAQNVQVVAQETKIGAETTTTVTTKHTDENCDCHTCNPRRYCTCEQCVTHHKLEIDMSEERNNSAIPLKRTYDKQEIQEKIISPYQQELERISKATNTNTTTTNTSVNQQNNNETLSTTTTTTKTVVEKNQPNVLYNINNTKTTVNQYDYREQSDVHIQSDIQTPQTIKQNSGSNYEIGPSKQLEAKENKPLKDTSRNETINIQNSKTIKNSNEITKQNSKLKTKQNLSKVSKDEGYSTEALAESPENETQIDGLQTQNVSRKKKQNTNNKTATTSQVKTIKQSNQSKTIIDSKSTKDTLKDASNKQVASRKKSPTFKDESQIDSSTRRQRRRSPSNKDESVSSGNSNAEKDSETEDEPREKIKEPATKDRPLKERKPQRNNDTNDDLEPHYSPRTINHNSRKTKSKTSPRSKDESDEEYSPKRKNSFSYDDDSGSQSNNKTEKRRRKRRSDNENDSRSPRIRSPYSREQSETEYPRQQENHHTLRNRDRSPEQSDKSKYRKSRPESSSRIRKEHLSKQTAPRARSPYSKDEENMEYPQQRKIRPLKISSPNNTSRRKSPIYQPDDYEPEFYSKDKVSSTKALAIPKMKKSPSSKNNENIESPRRRSKQTFLTEEYPRDEAQFNHHYRPVYSGDFDELDANYPRSKQLYNYPPLYSKHNPNEYFPNEPAVDLPKIQAQRSRPDFYPYYGRNDYSQPVQSKYEPQGFPTINTSRHDNRFYRGTTWTLPNAINSPNYGEQTPYNKSFKNPKLKTTLPKINEFENVTKNIPTTGEIVPLHKKELTCYNCNAELFPAIQFGMPDKITGTLQFTGNRIVFRNIEPMQSQSPDCPDCAYEKKYASNPEFKIDYYNWTEYNSQNMHSNEFDGDVLHDSSNQSNDFVEETQTMSQSVPNLLKLKKKSTPKSVSFKRLEKKELSTHRWNKSTKVDQALFKLDNILEARKKLTKSSKRKPKQAIRSTTTTTTEIKTEAITE